MDNTALTPILAGIARHALTTLGGGLVAGGYMESSDTSSFVGAGMVILGIIWSWWNKRGQAMVIDEIKRLRATKIAMVPTPEVKK